MKKLLFLFSLITIIGLWATPLNKQVKRIRKDLAVHSKSEEDSWNKIRKLEHRITKIEKHCAEGQSKCSHSADNDENEEDEDE